MQPLRIALVCLHTSPAAEPGSGDAGGMNVVIRYQAEALAALGHRVEILTRRSDPAQPDATLLAHGVTLRHLDAGPPRPVPKGEHETFIGAFRAALERLAPADLMHSHHWFSGMAALPVARARNIPHIQSFHSIAADHATPLSAGERPESPGRLAGEAHLAGESDAIVAVSRAEGDTVVDRLGAQPSRLSVVPPGVDTTQFYPAAAGSSEPLPCQQGPVDHQSAERPYVVVAGRIHPLKGIDLAIEALAAIPAPLRPDLVVAGDATADHAGHAAELRTLATQLGIAGSVHFVGPRSHQRLASLMRRACAVLIPSHSETYGLVALEAAASGVPVVAAASGGLREAVVDGQTGRVLANRDPRRWAEAITELLTDPERVRRLSQAALERARWHDWARSAAQLTRVYCMLVRPGDPACQPELVRA